MFSKHFKERLTAFGVKNTVLTFKEGKYVIFSVACY